MLSVDVLGRKWKCIREEREGLWSLCTAWPGETSLIRSDLGRILTGKKEWNTGLLGRSISHVDARTSARTLRQVSQSICSRAQEAHVVEQKMVQERAVGNEVLIGSVSIAWRASRTIRRILFKGEGNVMRSWFESHEDFSLGTLQNWVLEKHVWKHRGPFGSDCNNHSRRWWWPEPRLRLH